MNKGRIQRYSLLLAGVVAMGATAPLWADSPATQPATQQEMASEIKALRARLEQIESQQKHDEVDQDAQQAEVDKITQDVLKDADSRSMMVDTGGGVTAGYDNHRFFIQSEDGNFTLKPWIHIQVRDTTNWRQDGKDGGSQDDTQNGFEMRRARLGFDGNLFGKNLTYFINWATYRSDQSANVVTTTAITSPTGTIAKGTVIGTTSSEGGLPVLEEAWIKYRFGDSPILLKVGQMHDPLDHENIVGSKYRAPEASLQGDIFGNTDTFTQAATLIFDNDGPVRFEGGVTDGIRAANTAFEDDPNATVNYDGGVAARLEVTAMGKWHDYDQMTSLNDKEPLLVFGTGVDYSYGSGGLLGNGNNIAQNFYSISHTADVTFGIPNGLFMYLCYFGRYTNHNPGIPNGAPTDTSFGTGSQIGLDTYEPSVDLEVHYLIPGTHIEPFARYEYMHLQGTPTAGTPASGFGSNNNVTDISGGFHWYIYGHNLKFSAMLTYLPTGIPVNDTSADVLGNSGHAEVVFLTQLQLLL